LPDGKAAKPGGSKIRPTPSSARSKTKTACARRTSAEFRFQPGAGGAVGPSGKKLPTTARCTSALPSAGRVLFELRGGHSHAVFAGAFSADGEQALPTGFRRESKKREALGRFATRARLRKTLLGQRASVWTGGDSPPTGRFRSAGARGETQGRFMHGLAGRRRSGKNSAVVSQNGGVDPNWAFTGGGREACRETAKTRRTAHWKCGDWKDYRAGPVVAAKKGPFMSFARRWLRGSGGGLGGRCDRDVAFSCARRSAERGDPGSEMELSVEGECRAENSRGGGHRAFSVEFETAIRASACTDGE